MRQVANESHSVGHQHLALGGQFDVPQCGIERGEHARAFQHSRPSERVKEGRFTGIGVAHQSDHGDRHGLASLPLLAANALDVFQLLFDVADAAIDASAIGFELGLARSAGADTTAKLRHFYAAPSQSWKHVFELRQFHLQLSFTSACVAGKDVEDELGPVDDANVKLALQVALLRRSEFMIENHQVRRRGGDRAVQLFDLSAANQGGGIRALAALMKLSGDAGPCAEGKLAQFGHGFVSGK